MARFPTLFLCLLVSAAPITGDATNVANSSSTLPTAANSSATPVQNSANASSPNANNSVGINGNAAGRDQTNVAVIQTNTGANQTIIGAISDSHNQNNHTNILNQNTTNIGTRILNMNETVNNNNLTSTVNNLETIQNVYQAAAAAATPGSPSYGKANQLPATSDIIALIQSAQATSAMTYKLMLQMYSQVSPEAANSAKIASPNVTGPNVNAVLSSGSVPGVALATLFMLLLL